VPTDILDILKTPGAGLFMVTKSSELIMDSHLDKVLSQYYPQEDVSEDISEEVSEGATKPSQKPSATTNKKRLNNDIVDPEESNLKFLHIIKCSRRSIDQPTAYRSIG
jgi:hypothetical protein